MFDEGWLHQDKSATFKAVYLLNARYVEDLRRKKADPSLPPLPRADLDRARYLFHGTQRACGIGSSTSTPCHNEECRVCCILRESFKMSCKSQRMFGPGIYSTTSSSKADVYAYNHHLRSHSHVILLCKVVCNRPQALFEAEHGRTQPDPGYNAVQAVTKDQGGAVEYNEYVVYREDAIVPVGIVVYARKGWKP